MKLAMKEVRQTRTKSYLKHKLISATALLLVSTIMMVSTSYAWYVLSTAPEATNIKTQVGANGALEIALLDARSWNDLNRLDMGDIDESVTDENPASATAANLIWGNLINLDDASYGLDKIILNPARLYIEQDGSDVSGKYKVNSILLKTPVYGEDGRVKSLDKTSAVAYTFANGTFSNPNGYGVRAIGTSATMSAYQLGMNAARSTLVTRASAARTAASNILQSTGGSLANIVVDYAVSNKMTGYTDADVANIKKLAVGLDTALDEIESAMRYAFAGYITTSGAYYMDLSGETAVQVEITPDNYQTKLAEITGGTKTLDQLMEEYPGALTIIPGGEEDGAVDDIEEFIAKYNQNKTAVDDAIDQCDELSGGSYTWSQISGIIMPLVNTNAMLVNGKNIDTLKTELIVDGSIDYDKAFELVSGGITITVPSGSGILSDIADFADDYTALVPVAVSANVGGRDLNVNMNVNMTTATTATPTHLSTCSNGLKSATVADAVGSNSITDYYGYAIDLAFRTNATESNLLLQTEPENRIYDGDTRNAALQGGGSYMSFTTSSDLSVTKMVRLMSGIRVVLMDGNQQILGIAALDTALGKNVYTVLDEETRNETGMYAYLDGSAGVYQNSDLINQEQYNSLPDISNVTFNKTTGKVTAKLYLYNYEMTRSATSTEDEIKYTGGLTLGSKGDGVITALKADVVQKVTALVYLDGSVVNNSTVASNSMYSMTGVLNLQFSSSAELLPATNTKLQTSGSDVIYTELDGTLYEAGYLSYNGVLAKVKEGYSVYTGSDNKIYFANETSDYTELSAESFATALTAVTAGLTADSTAIAVNGTANLTAALSDSGLDATGYRFVKTGDDSDTVTTHTVSDNVLTVTGKATGEAGYYVVITAQIGSQTVDIKSDSVTVTVS